MKPLLKYVLILVTSLISLWFIGKVTNAFTLYKSSTPANEPTIKTDSRFFVSNLVEPRLLDFVCFYADDKFTGRQLRTFRMCGQAGDVLEIKQGNLIVNGKLFDNQLNVNHNYMLSNQDYEEIRNLLQIDEESLIHTTKDSLLISLTDSFASDHKLQSTRIILPQDYRDEEIANAFSMDWNQDNFGPVTVPPDKCFLLGDNRNNAFDSRYLGFIDNSAITATVLWKK